VPALRIVDEALWQAVATRQAATRRVYLRDHDGRLHGRPPSDIDSQYLLTGMTTCGACGGGLTVMSRSHGDHRKFLYRCQNSWYRGETICTNRRTLPMLDTNAAVLRAIETACLTPRAITAIVRETLAALQPAEDAVPRDTAVRADLLVVEAEIAKLTTAIAKAPDLGSLLDALRAKEHRRDALQRDLAALDGVGRVQTVDPAVLTPVILAKLGDWSGLMGRRVAQARQILRHLLVGRVVFTPHDDGVVEFVGYASIGPLPVGTVLARLRNAGATPGGHRPRRPALIALAHPCVYWDIDMTRPSDIVHSDPSILGGTPVFVGTRVPIQSLFDYLEGGETLDEFLRQFPSVGRDQAIAALDLARVTLLAGARSS
jgi:uncharacterized protein (DUF433 family)